MDRIFLNGKITVSSFAAPTNEDVKKINALSKEDRKSLLEEILINGENSPISNRTLDEIWQSAVSFSDFIM